MAGATICGGTGTVSGPPTFWATLAGIFGIFFGPVASAIFGVAGKLGAIDVAGMTASTSVLGKLGASLGLSGWGVLALAAIIVTAVVTALSIIIWAKSSHDALCGVPVVGKFECVTGVINTVEAGFHYGYSELVGFQNNQPRIDVVVKSIYWPILTLNNPPMVWCAACTNCPPSAAAPAQILNPNSTCSPMMPCYYHNNQVCSASAGASAGAAIGAALGAVGGVILAIWLFGLMGCSFTAIFSWICIIVLAVVCLIVVAVVVIAALIGSTIGTQAGKAAAGGSASPMAGSVTLMPGAYVSVLGNMVQSPHSLGANVIWFAGWTPDANGQTVDDLTASNMNGTTVLGKSTGLPPFCFTDPDGMIPASMDICPMP
ncbi:LytS family sensor histidine kinase [Terracidiphilus gabretensis]|uniref:hypothetical protein n=1 Tax=Terracidiphilus gabretensis TaxID=1577687 RepID=UPI00071B47B9|nr:hypothetical protein [Terracidiphilus gabretensis]